jgi:hypothetical protein
VQSPEGVIVLFPKVNDLGDIAFAGLPIIQYFSFRYLTHFQAKNHNTIVGAV